ncbi:Collagenase ColH [Phycisphaerales bacterium]|nr:Collagenase ColH [Phycisphaerales bacterium]
MNKQGCVAMSAAILAAFSGVALAGGSNPPEPRASAWLYPGVDFQDGRAREHDGRVWPDMVHGMDAGGDPEDSGPFAACFAEDANPTPEQWDALNASIAEGYDSRYRLGQRWSGGVSGAPITLSWSFVPDGVPWGSAGGLGGQVASNLFARMDSLFGAANRATWVNQFVNVFNRWSALSGVNYTRVTAAGVDWDDGAAWGNAGNDTTRGDIRIGMHNLDGGNGVLAYNQFPDSGDMVIDSSEGWNAAAGTYLFLRNVIAHEHGHGLGFAHVCPANATKLMEPFVSTSYDGPRHDDLRAVHAYYGDPNESNNSSAVATDLGTLAAGTTTTIGTVPSPAIGNTSIVSLHANDNDFYRLTLTEPHLVNITATPVGLIYLEGAQNGDGSCQPGTSLDSRIAANLKITAYQSNGSTELRAQDATAAGTAETITGLLMSNGNNFARIHAATANSTTQCYNLSITVTNTNLACTASDGTFNDFVRVTWPAVANATGYIVMRNTVNSQGGSTVATLGAVTTYDDTTAVPGTTYFYFVRAQQTGNPNYRYMTLTGNSGFRGVGNTPPTANAGPDQVVQDADGNLSEMVAFDGSASNDPDGTITNYLWQEGVNTLANGPSATPSVNLSAGVHTITLTVTDNNSATDSDDVLVTVNRRPVANAGADAVVDDMDGNGSESVSVFGAGSNDPDGTIVNYLWQEGAATLSDGPTANPTISLGWGVHNLSLTVTDNLGGTASDSVVVTINRVPVADAGADQTVVDSDNSGAEMITLNGSGSNDPDGTITNYLWEEGAATLANGVNPGPSVSLGVGIHSITLTVTDNRGSTGSDTVIVEVQPGTPPCDPDVNCDGAVNGFDVEATEQAINGDFSNFCQATADLNGDGAENGFDIETEEQRVNGAPC